jgi:hypothetical protein
MFIEIYIFVVSIFFFLMIGYYIFKYRGLPIDVYKPGAAWSLALIYFAFCNIVSASSGTLETLLKQPIVTSNQLTDPMWIFLGSFCFIYIFFAYWILWARMTLTFDRKFYIGSEIVFGLLWGISVGQILLSFYHFWSMTSLPKLVIYILSYACMGAWQYFIHDYFWDIRVSPEHDTPRSIKIKTFVSHLPNVAICLLFLSIFNNYLLFVATQTFALIATSVSQKFPSPWAKENFHSPMIKPGLFGFPRGAGYQENVKEG